MKSFRHLDCYKTHILHGVTGSGKTETYLYIAEKVISSGKQVLVLLPEILLVTQLRTRFESYFSDVVAWHSGVKESEKTIN